MTPTETAQILVEALPYIRQFAGKSVVVKLGGAAIDKDSDLALAQDVLLLRSVGVRCVLVHGGGPQVDTMLRRVGKEPEFKDGLRVTDEETLVYTDLTYDYGIWNWLSGPIVRLQAQTIIDQTNHR